MIKFNFKTIIFFLHKNVKLFIDFITAPIPSIR